MHINFRTQKFSYLGQQEKSTIFEKNILFAIFIECTQYISHSHHMTYQQNNNVKKIIQSANKHFSTLDYQFSQNLYFGTILTSRINKFEFVSDNVFKCCGFGVLCHMNLFTLATKCILSLKNGAKAESEYYFVFVYLSVKLCYLSCFL